MKKLNLTLICLCVCSILFAQYYNNTDVNQNNIIINNNTQPIIERVKYIEKYRPIYIQQTPPKRKARSLSKPICLIDNLWIYPEDLGNYVNHSQAYEILNVINKQELYGRNDWRIPTSAELRLMENYADRIGLGDEIYLAQDHRNGILRPVSTGPSIAEKKEAYYREQREQYYKEQAEIARQKQEALQGQELLVKSGIASEFVGLLWQLKNIGAKNNIDDGTLYYHNDVRCPSGWRLPTSKELTDFAKRAKIMKKPMSGGWLKTYYYTSDNLYLPAIKYVVDDGVYDLATFNYTNSKGSVRCVKQAIAK